METQSVTAPGCSRVTFLNGRGDLPMLGITTPWSTAEIYLHGAHVAHFQKSGEPPLLFLSQCSRFLPDAPIRGGIPIIFPWFGKPAGKPGQHGFARLRDWELRELTTEANGTVRVRLQMPECNETPVCAACGVEYLVTLGETLTAVLSVTNESGHPMTFENCLHTYVAVGDIGAVTVKGLEGRTYLNQPTGFTRHTDTAEALRVAEEVDRCYLDTRDTVEIHDAAWRRVIRVEKEGSLSTVVWNPWIAKAKAMPDFGDEEYRTMLCVESGNVVDNALTLAPGACASLKVKLSTAPAD